MGVKKSNLLLWVATTLEILSRGRGTKKVKNRCLRAIRRSVSDKVFLTAVHACVCSCIDYCNSLLIGLPKTRLAPLQTVLNAAARMIARLPPYAHISDYMIKDFHWLPILARVRYKVLVLVTKCQQGLAPRYLCELMSKPRSARSYRPLRSADRCDHLVPWSRTSLSQNRASAVVDLALWNDTPPALRSVMLQGISSASLRSLKTYFHLPVLLRAPLNSLLREVLYKYPYNIT